MKTLNNLRKFSKFSSLNLQSHNHFSNRAVGLGSTFFERFQSGNLTLRLWRVFPSVE